MSLTQEPDMDDIKSQIENFVNDDKGTVKQKKLLLEELRGLVSTPGWMYIQQVLQSQAEMRYMQIGRSLPTSFGDVVAQAGLRGEASGMDILKSLPDNLIASLEASIKADIQFEREKEGLDDDGDDGIELG